MSPSIYTFLLLLVAFVVNAFPTYDQIYETLKNETPEVDGVPENSSESLKRLDFIDRLCTLLDKIGGSSFIKCANSDVEISKPENSDYGAITSPVVFIPGLCGSALYGRWDLPHDTKDDPDFENTYNVDQCSIKSDKWSVLWMEVTAVFRSNCISRLLAVHWNLDKKTFENSEGVQVNITDFGGFDDLYYVHFFEDIVIDTPYIRFKKDMEKAGYQVGVNLFAAPYDWRYPVSQTLKDTWFGEALKKLVESAVEGNNKQKVTMVGHSLGTSILSEFLTKIVDDDWIQNNIEQIFYLAPTFVGSLKAVECYIFGCRSYDIFLSKGNQIKFERTGIVLDLFPRNPNVVSDRTALKVPGGTIYGSGNWSSFLKYMDLEDAIGFYEGGTLYSQPPAFHNVKTVCVVGVGKDTIYSMDIIEWHDPLKPLHPPRFTKKIGDGDGTIPKYVDSVCKNWQKQHSDLVSLFYFDASHVELPAESNVVNLILKSTTD